MKDQRKWRVPLIRIPTQRDIMRITVHTSRTDPPGEYLAAEARSIEARF